MNNSTPTGYGCPALLPLFREIVKNKKEKGNPHTASNYESFINKLSNFLGDDGENIMIHNITQEWVEEYLE